jgi:peptidoglycan/LPS O-acetylase OafA/YrhL
LLAYFVVNQHGLLFPFALFPLIVGFSNLRLKAGAWWTRAAATVGDASYSMYLIHPIVFMGVSSVTSKLQFLPYWTEEPIRFISIGTAIAISLVSWRYLERPAMKIGQRMIKPQYSLPLQDTSMTDAWSAALEVERERSTQ